VLLLKPDAAEMRLPIVDIALPCFDKERRIFLSVIHADIR
jgi:hypothetical protein